MSIIFEENIKKETVEEVAKKMLIAARTAPKARGIDNLAMAYVNKETIKELSDKMKEMGGKDYPGFFLRDAENILAADVVFLIGTKISPIGLQKCGLCGFENCDEKMKNPNSPCAYNTGDLGIAIGSAVSVAMDHRIDNRIMRSVGNAAMELKLLGEDIRIAYGIPLSASAKNPFFDRLSK